jgi:L-2-hydroxyglutarate oxidase LhgO
MKRSDVRDFIIIGAGVNGASIARKLSSYQLDVALVDKECDFSFGTSKSNSGIIHGGFHHNAKHLKARLEIWGNAMFDQLQRELGFPFRRCGILVVATHSDEMKMIGQLYAQGVENGSIGIEMCPRERMLELEPKVDKQYFVGGIGRFFLNSIVVTVTSVVGLLVLVALEGYAFAMFDFRGKRALYICVLMGFMLPPSRAYPDLPELVELRCARAEKLL